MKNIKRIFIGLAALVLLLWLSYFWNNTLRFRTTPLRREVTSLMEKSKHTELDFRGVNSVEWDEAAYLGPYMNICDLGIKGYEQESPNCYANGETDSELIFLSKNVVLEIVPLKNLWERPFDGSRFKRLPRGEMVFVPLDGENGTRVYAPKKMADDLK